MVANFQDAFMSAEAYLAGEAYSTIKHEYQNGTMFAMAGATDAHVTIAGNLFALLRGHVRGRGCRVFMSDMKAWIEAENSYFYPDVMVTSDPRDRDSPLSKRYPCLIVEVLSETTEAFDRGDKFAAYQQLESLQEYVLISQTRRRVDCYRRNPEGHWVLYSFRMGDRLHLHSLDFQTDTAALYEDVDEPDGPGAPTFSLS